VCLCKVCNEGDKKLYLGYWKVALKQKRQKPLFLWFDEGPTRDLYYNSKLGYLKKKQEIGLGTLILG